MRRAVSACLIAASVALTGCGSVAADLFAVTRAGAIPGARLTLRVTDDGRAACNGRALVAISSAQLITAREITRDLTELGSRRLAAGPATVLSYRARLRDAVVAWADDSPRQPKATFRLAKLTRDIAKGPCGLPR